MSEQSQGNQPSRGGVDDLVNRISNDPQLRQQLLDNPQQTVADLGLTGQNRQGDVTGYMMCGHTCIVSCTCDTTCTSTCKCTDC